MTEVITYTIPKCNAEENFHPYYIRNPVTGVCTCDICKHVWIEQTEPDWKSLYFKAVELLLKTDGHVIFDDNTSEEYDFITTEYQRHKKLA